MKNISKKTVGVLSLGMFMFGLIVPIFSFAQTQEEPLIIKSIVPNIIKAGGAENAKITAQIFDGLNFTSAEVSFSASGSLVGTTGAIFETNPCVVTKEAPRIPSCEINIKFLSLNKSSGGVIQIIANSTIDGESYTSKPVSLTIENTSTPTPPTPVEPPAPPKNTDTSYTLLSPLPDGSGGTLKEFESDPTKNPCAFGKYMQIIFQLIIGISAVLAVVMIVYGGIEYMTGGAVSEKENGKETITNAILGLLIALGAWLLLNTLNPQLLNVCLRLPEAKIKIIESFEVAGALGGEFGTWKPIKVNFNTEAYPAAKAAFEKTGIDIAFVLAVFDQETGNGKNVGRCYWKDSGVMMELTPPPNGRRMDQTAFASIMSELREDPNTTPVSCPSPKGGWGGAMGHMQFLPTTWVIYKEKGKTLLGGKTPNPWISQDAIMMAAIYLQALNGKNDMKNAACKYYSGRSCDNRTDNPNMFYGNEVMEKRAFIEMQIAEAIKNGKIKK